MKLILIKYIKNADLGLLFHFIGARDVEEIGQAKDRVHEASRIRDHGITSVRLRAVQIYEETKSDIKRKFTPRTLECNRERK